MAEEFRFVECVKERHGTAMLHIFNDAILNTTSLYELEPRTPEFMSSWFDDKKAGDWPVFGLENDDGVLIGFATYGAFRPRPCYRFTVEHSIYVDSRFRGRGHGKRLLEEVLRRAELQGFHVVVGVIDSSNAASVTLHEKAGFSSCGVIRHAGYKFGRWLDTCIMQLLLKDPQGAALLSLFSPFSPSLVQ